ncbi:hypothetical protein ACHAXT_011361 [Thalassiosira profunda]
MFISHWFAELGVTDILAPLSPEKESATKDGASSDVHREEESAFWSIVAPRSETKPKPSAGGESHSQLEEMGDAQSKPAAEAAMIVHRDAPATVHPPGKMVQCRHCHKLTPADGPATANGGARSGGNATEKAEAHPTTPLSSLPPQTPANTPALNNEWHSAQAATTDDEQSRLQQQVLEACARTAATAAGSTSEWEAKHALFSLCGAPPKPPKKGKDGKPIAPKVGEDGKPAKSKGVKKIDKLLGNQPQLVLCRSAGMASLGLADGHTVLHAACHAGNGEVVAYLLEGWVSLGPVDELNDDENSEDGEGARPKIDLNERDLQGQTALHVAAGQGHVDVVKMLKEAYEEMAARMDDWDRMMARMIVEDVDNNGEEGEEDAGSLGGPKEVEELGEELAKLSTSEAAAQMTLQTPTAAAPKSKSPMRQRQTPLSRSPKRSPKRPAGRLSPLRSPKFAGPTAPVDLSGTTPLGRAATSPVPKAKKNRGELEKLLYEEGDRSIVGAGRTPPRERCGPRGRVSPVPAGGMGAATTISGTSSYLSPTPGKRRGRHATPGSAASSQYATPFGTPPTILEGAPLAGDGQNNPRLQLRFAAAEMNGWRIEMEDKILARYPLYEAGEGLPTRPAPEDADAAAAASPLGPTLGLFGVFDGHGDGGYASEFVATRLEGALTSQPSWAAAYYGCNDSEGNGPMESVLTQACYDLDEALRTDRARPRDGGTTAIVAVASDRYVFVANVGDSRCILVRRKEAANNGEAAAKPCWEPSELDVVPMSEDHKPDLPEERSRIESAGLTVQTDHVPPSDDDEDGEFTAVHRVKLSDKELLGVSRAFGDHDYKSNSELSASRQAVVCTPDILIRERDDSLDMYLVLACDGIWDVMSNDEAGAFVARRAAERLGDEADGAVEGEVLARVGDNLLAECLRKGSRDNMSVLIVALPASGIAGVAQSSSKTSVGQNEEVTDGTVRALEYE